MRIGINSMCGCVRQYGMEPTSGDVYIFVGRRRNTMKLLHYEREGYVLYYKRLERGRFYNRIFLKEKEGFRTIRWDGYGHSFVFFISNLYKKSSDIVVCSVNKAFNLCAQY